MDKARRPLLAVVVALFSICATIFGNDSVNDLVGWLLLGVALTLLIEWAVLEILNSQNKDDKDDRERRE